MRALVLLVAVAVFGQTRDRAPYPPPGRLVDAGGYRVHIDCTGSGSPAVMIVGGGFSFDWSLVQPEVARFTRVCTYDASGTAWSDPGPGRGCPAWVNEVHELLKKAEAGGPYVMVGLSAGAVIARLYATTYPDEVAGVVLVDHAFLPKAAEKPALPAVPSDVVDSPPVLLSMAPIVFSHEDEPGFKNLPKEAQELDRWASSSNPDLPTAETAAQCIAAADAASGRKPYPLGRTPLAVISTRNDSAGYGELQQQLLTLSLDSRQFIGEHSFHSIEISDPSVVVDSIREVVIAARTHSLLNQLLSNQPGERPASRR